MALPREIIDKIRKEEFGIGIGYNADPESREVIGRLKLSLHRAIEQLSQDLYSKETHFVLEVIQNADDNKYKEGIEPSLKFSVNDERILVQNNETGFEEENVRAICAVGKSTKVRSRGYIGEKGIGFKSVFRISEGPCIFSNGFHFKFKQKDEELKLGFIVPYWIDEIPDYIDKNLTNIVLPLKVELKAELGKFSEIDPSLLLFLHKLKAIEVENYNEPDARRFEREDRDGRVELKHPKGKEYWKLIPTPLDVPERIQDGERRGIEETEIILGFPLRTDFTANTGDAQNVFAFLPIRSYGFKFIIQADFLVPASREEIHKDKQWNKWIRDNISLAFKKAVDAFKQDNNLRHTFYNYIPLAADISDEFFSPVADQTLQILQETECILTCSGSWRKPQGVLRADERIRALIPEDDLRCILGKEYVSPDIRANRSVLEALKVPDFTPSDLFSFLHNEEWLKQQSDEWFAELYEYLSGEAFTKQLSEEQKKQLSELRILRLENNQLTSALEGAVFFPLDKKGDYGFEDELHIVKRGVLDSDKQGSENLKKSLIKLGVREASAVEIVESHILPLYENVDKENNWQSKGNAKLIGYVRYIRDHLEDYKNSNNARLNGKKNSWEQKEDPLDRLKRTLFLKSSQTNDKVSYHAPIASLFLPLLYGNTNELEQLFEGIEEVHFVHTDYYDDSRKRINTSGVLPTDDEGNNKKLLDEEVSKWHVFFLKIGVNEGLRIERKNETYLSYEQKQELRNNSRCTSEQVKDYRLIPLQRIIENLKESGESKAQRLLMVLESQWKDLEKFKKLSYQWYYYTSYRKEADATWLHQLMISEWIPTSKGCLAAPSQVFLDKPEIRALLGDLVPYAHVDENLAKDIGANCEATTGGVLSNLTRMIEQKSHDKNTFHALYQFLDSHYGGNEEQINAAFSDQPLIFIPDPQPAYYTRQQVIWQDVRSIFGDTRGYLDKHYPALKRFFTEKLGVSPKPEPKDYAQALEDLSREEQITRQHEQVIFRIYRELDSCLNPDKIDTLISDEEWWEDFIVKQIYLTDKGVFCTNHGSLFVNDNNEIYSLLSGKPHIAFLKLQQNQIPKVQHFLKAIQIPFLSQAVNSDISIGDVQSIDGLTNQIRMFTPYLLRFLYQLEHSAYEQLKQNGTLMQLKKMVCYSVDTLYVQYELASHTVSNQQSAKLYNGNLYVQKDRVEDTDFLAVELSRLFGSLKGLDDFLALLFDKKSEEKIQNLMRAKNIQELPDEEKEWFGEVEVLKEEPPDKEEESLPESKEEKSESKNREAEQAGAEQVEGTGKENTQRPREETQRSPSAGTESSPSSTSTVTSVTVYDWEPEIKSAEAEVSVEEFIPHTHPPESQHISEMKRDSSNTLPDHERDEETLSQAAKEKIGRWGEAYAVKYLKEKLEKKYSLKLIETADGFALPEAGGKAEIHWLNKNGDSGRGHDIKVIEDEIEIFIEVKSTKTDAKEWFDLSRPQWEFAVKHGGRFHIYRVFNAGTGQAKLLVITDPNGLWHEGKLDAYPIRLKI